MGNSPFLMGGKIVEYLLTAEEMRACDRRTIEEIGIPSLVLMERAALAVAEEIFAACEEGSGPECWRTEGFGPKRPKAEGAGPECWRTEGFGPKRPKAEGAGSECWRPEDFGPKRPKAGGAGSECRRTEGIGSGRLKGRILVLAGCGNNGGDGLALARLLTERGCQVDAVICGNPEKATAEWKTQRAVLTHYPVRVWASEEFPAGRDGGIGRKSEEPEYTIIVDALLGLGLSREVTGEYARLIEWSNAAPGWKVAVDLPSGVHSDDGRIMGCAFRADLTVALAFPKRGMYLYPGCEYCGRVKVKKIGIPLPPEGGCECRKDPKAGWDSQEAPEIELGRKEDPEIELGRKEAPEMGPDRWEASEMSWSGGWRPEMFRLTESLAELLPVRKSSGNKGTFGKVLLAAGSRNMAGAALLSGGSCYRSGTGMVKVLTEECNRLILQEALPEALLETYEPDRKIEEGTLGSQASLSWADVLALGPGLGTEERALELLELFLKEGKKPLVIDADGLNLLAAHPGLQEILAKQAGEGRTVILTPHMGELSRLTGLAIGELKARPLEHARELTGRLHCILVSKDARTLVCREEGAVCLNTVGNSGMATAGSGDVLTGMIAGLLAQGMEPFAAACIGVYWHGLAGDRAAEELGTHGVTASAIISHMAPDKDFSHDT